MGLFALDKIRITAAYVVSKKYQLDSSSSPRSTRNRSVRHTMTESPGANLWATEAHSADYLRRADSIPHRTEGESALLEFMPAEAHRILDLGTGAGRLVTLVKATRPNAEFVALDFSPTMLNAVRKQFGDDRSVAIVDHDFDNKLPSMGRFDAAISSFAIHHLVHERKRALYEEIFEISAVPLKLE